MVNTRKRTYNQLDSGKSTSQANVTSPKSSPRQTRNVKKPTGETRPAKKQRTAKKVQKAAKEARPKTKAKKTPSKTKSQQVPPKAQSKEKAKGTNPTEGKKSKQKLRGQEGSEAKAKPRLRLKLTLKRQSPEEQAREQRLMQVSQGPREPNGHPSSSQPPRPAQNPYTARPPCPDYGDELISPKTVVPVALPRWAQPEDMDAASGYLTDGNQTDCNSAPMSLSSDDDIIFDETMWR
ncbi:hypothetical protein BJX61DRAFT_15933 [Aspergillus egyptiacus]|nr:hypothetical protein BJX61DRAFT_15933 [Aspergillus egyptiacus]